MIIFFDKNIGTAIPKALQLLKPPFGIEYHEKHFAYNEEDDKWLPTVGRNKWFIVGHDRYDKSQSELYAIKKYKIGYFRLWGAKAPKWEKIKVFFRACEYIIEATKSTARPFGYSVKKRGNLKRIKLPRL